MDRKKALIRTAGLVGLLTVARPTLVMAAGQEHGFTWYGASPVAGLIPVHVFHALKRLKLIDIVSKGSLIACDSPLQ